MTLDFTAREDEPRFVIPPALRAEIDRRVAEGRVTRCPPMTFSEAGAPAQVGRRAPAVVALGDGREVRAGGGWNGAGVSAAAAARRAEVLRLADGRLTCAEIAARLGANPRTIGTDIHRLRDSGHEVSVRRAGAKP